MLELNSLVIVFNNNHMKCGTPSDTLNLLSIIQLNQTQVSKPGEVYVN